MIGFSRTKVVLLKGRSQKVASGHPSHRCGFRRVCLDHWVLPWDTSWWASDHIPALPLGLGGGRKASNPPQELSPVKRGSTPGADSFAYEVGGEPSRTPGRGPAAPGASDANTTATGGGPGGPDLRMLRLLAEYGASFDCASQGELELVAGPPPPERSPTPEDSSKEGWTEGGTGRLRPPKCCRSASYFFGFAFFQFCSVFRCLFCVCQSS